MNRIATAAVALGLVSLAGCAITPPQAGPAPRLDEPAKASCTYRVGDDPARPVDPPPSGEVPATGTVTYVVALGDGLVTLNLDRSLAPCAVHSFEHLAQQGFYHGTTCHRLATMGTFLLQCGDPTGTGLGGPGYTFDDELGAATSYSAGTVAMANAGPHGNGSQFMLVYKDTALEPRYTVFGRMDAASTQVVSDLAMQGHDSAFGDSGHPHGNATILAVSAG